MAGFAQHGTVSAVAEAIHSTQSAVSKQLRTIEHIGGMPLFIRARHGLTPTAAGMIYIEQARIALGAIETAALRTERLTSSRPILRLHVLPILGDRWFMSRLPRFTAGHEEIDVQFVTFAPRETFREVDVVFRFGNGNWRGWRADYFLGREILLVGAPQLFAEQGAVSSVRDVQRHRLIGHVQTAIRWEDFLSHHGADAVDLRVAHSAIIRW